VSRTHSASSRGKSGLSAVRTGAHRRGSSRSPAPTRARATASSSAATRAGVSRSGAGRPPPPARPRDEEPRDPGRASADRRDGSAAEGGRHRSRRQRRHRENGRRVVVQRADRRSESMFVRAAVRRRRGATAGRGTGGGRSRARQVLGRPRWLRDNRAGVGDASGRPSACPGALEAVEVATNSPSLTAGMTTRRQVAVTRCRRGDRDARARDDAPARTSSERRDADPDQPREDGSTAKTAKVRSDLVQGQIAYRVTAADSSVLR
jgi:hypothetical protein